jgi:pimeloyl-ACP methyl ester carboxylesterase
VKPPGQPAKGPGGAAKSYGGVSATRHDGPDNGRDYWTFVPTRWRGKGPAPTTLPVVVFAHGYGALEPRYYRPWIDHLARKGNIVVYPQYQASLLTPQRQYTPNAAWSVAAALTGPLAGGSPRPRLARGALYVGHSYGGVVASNLASRAAAIGLPTPNALLATEPYYEMIDPSLAGLPRSTRFVCVVGDDDTLVGRRGCDELFRRTTLPAKRRNYVWLFTDRHGSPDLLADHRAPSSRTVDALDYRGFWKLADGLRDCAQLRKNCDYGFGKTSRQRSLGRWSDGTRVRRMSVTRNPPKCPKGSDATGC